MRPYSYLPHSRGAGAHGDKDTTLHNCKIKSYCNEESKSCMVYLPTRVLEKHLGPGVGRTPASPCSWNCFTSALREMLPGEPFPCGPLSPDSDNPCLEPREEQPPQLTQVQSLGGWSCVSVVHGVLDIHKPHPLPALPLLRHLQFQ